MEHLGQLITLKIVVGLVTQVIHQYLLFWSPPEVPLRKDTSDSHVAEARNCVENEHQCRRYQLLSYFDYSLASNLPTCDPTTCCDACKQKAQKLAFECGIDINMYSIITH